MKKLLAILGVLLAAGGFGLITAQSASAAGNCYLDSCAGKDPQGSGCSTGAYTIALGVDLRYSPSCASVWYRPEGGGVSSCTNGLIQVKRWYPYGKVETHTYSVGYLYYRLWSTMAPMQQGDQARFSCSGVSYTGWYNTLPA